MDLSYHVHRIIKRSSEVRLGAMKYTVTNKEITKGLQCLDLRLRENSNEIFWKNKRHKAKNPKSCTG